MSGSQDEQPAKVIFEYKGKQETFNVKAGMACNYTLPNGFYTIKEKLGIKEKMKALYISLPDGGGHGDLWRTPLKTKPGQKYGPVKIEARQRIRVNPQTQQDMELISNIPNNNIEAYYMPQDAAKLFGIWNGQYENQLRQIFQEELDRKAQNTPVLVMPGKSVGNAPSGKKGYNKITKCPVIILQDGNQLKIWVPKLENDDILLTYPEDKNFSTIPITCQDNIVLFTSHDFKAAMKFPVNPDSFPFEEETEKFNKLVQDIYKKQNQTTSLISQNPNNTNLGTGYNNNNDTINQINNLTYNEQSLTTANFTGPNYAPPQNNLITLKCVNNEQNGLHNEYMIIDEIKINQDQTIGKLKERILEITNGKQEHPLKENKVQTNDFVICTVNQQGEPTAILDDKNTISKAFGNNNQADYVIVPRELTILIGTGNQQKCLKYQIIVNQDNKDEFNEQPLKDFITEKLENSNLTTNDDMPDCYYGGAGWGAIVHLKGAFCWDTKLNITTKQKTVPQASNLNPNSSNINNPGNNTLNNTFGNNTNNTVNNTLRPTIVNKIAQKGPVQLRYKTNYPIRTSAPNLYKSTYYGVTLGRKLDHQRGPKARYIPHPMIIQKRTNSQFPQIIRSKPIVGPTFLSQNPNQVIQSYANQPQLNINPNTSVLPTPKFVPKLVPMPTNNNNSHFVRNVNIYENGNKKVLTNVQVPMQVQMQPVLVPAQSAYPTAVPVQVPKPVPMQLPVPAQQVQTFVPKVVPKLVPVQLPAPVLMKKPVRPPVVPVAPMRPPVVPVPVAPVQQSGGNRPEPNTYYAHRKMNNVNKWDPIQMEPPLQDYQTFIDYSIHNNPQEIANLSEPFYPRYQYVDEWGFRFTSNRPIYKDVNNNLVTLGRAFNDPPL